MLIWPMSGVALTEFVFPLGDYFEDGLRLPKANYYAIIFCAVPPLTFFSSMEPSRYDF